MAVRHTKCSVQDATRDYSITPFSQPNTVRDLLPDVGVFIQADFVLCRIPTSCTEQKSSVMLLHATATSITGANISISLFTSHHYKCRCRISDDSLYLFGLILPYCIKDCIRKYINNVNCGEYIYFFLVCL